MAGETALTMASSALFETEGREDMVEEAVVGLPAAVAAAAGLSTAVAAAAGLPTAVAAAAGLPTALVGVAAAVAAVRGVSYEEVEEGEVTEWG